jgi:hypothetical protein
VPLISLESSTCSHFQNDVVFDFRSIRSNNGLFRRKLEAQTDPAGPILANSDILFLPKMLSGANTFEISDFQEDEIEAG